MHFFIVWVFLKNREHKKKAILYYCFLVRLYHEDDDVLHDVEADLYLTSNKTLEDIHDLFYKEYVQGFCREKTKKGKALHPTINIHVFQHLLESRRRTGPLQRTSTESFEALYSVLRRCYRAGTKNTPKQAFENYYMRQK